MWFFSDFLNKTYLFIKTEKENSEHLKCYFEKINQW